MTAVSFQVRQQPAAQRNFPSIHGSAIFGSKMEGEERAFHTQENKDSWLSSPLTFSFPPKPGQRGTKEIESISFGSLFFFSFLLINFVLWKISNMYKNRITEWICMCSTTTCNNYSIFSYAYLHSLPILLCYFRENLRHHIILPIIFYPSPLLYACYSAGKKGEGRFLGPTKLIVSKGDVNLLKHVKLKHLFIWQIL